MPPKLTPREILEEVKRRITAKPESYDQGDWCGTTCCIAGHIVAVCNLKKVGRYDTPYVAAELIQDPNIEEPWIFECPFPGNLGRSYAAAYPSKDYPRMAAVGCKAIDRYMKERGI